MRFNEFNEGIDPGAKAAIKGMRELSGDQYYGLYKTMKDVAGHDGEKQTSPEGATDHEVSDKPFAYAYTDEEKNMIKGVDPKAKQITSDKSEELDESNLKEFAPGHGGGESGRWYTDDQMTDLVGDGWWNDLDISGDISKQEMIQEAQAWLDDQGYSVHVLNCKVNDDDMEWFIEGSFQNSNFAKKGMAEAGSSYDANRTGFAKPQRNDDERHDLDAPRPLIYGLKINGKIWQKDGNTVTFFTKERAMAARNSILAKRPELEIGLVQRPQD